MWDFLGSLITPAFVSLFVSLWAGRLMENLRARRDHITKLFEGAREDVRRAIEAAVDYFATPPCDRKGIQEAKVLSSDRELRASLPLLLEKVRSLESRAASDSARAALETVLMELTGGNFQSSEGEFSREHLSRLAHAGAILRVSLARLRDAELRAQLDTDPVLRSWVRWQRWFEENQPFRAKP